MNVVGLFCDFCGVFVGFLSGNVLTMCEQRMSNDCQACGRSGASRPRADNSQAVVNAKRSTSLTIKSFTLPGSRSWVRLRARRFGERLLLGSGRSRAASRCSASLRLRAPHLPAGLRPSGRPFASLAPLPRPPAAVAPYGDGLAGAIAPPRPPLLGCAPLRARVLAATRALLLAKRSVRLCSRLLASGLRLSWYRVGSVLRPLSSPDVLRRGTASTRGNRPSAASSRRCPPRGEKMYRLRTSRAPTQPFGARVLFCLPWVVARFRARSASTPPPCPLPSGGGWPRARPRTLCARHVAPRASRHARPDAVAASAIRLGRNHTAAPLARSAFLLA